MSDYPNSHLHRSDGVSGRGLLIAAGVLGLIILGLILIGGGSDPQALPSDAITPEATAPAATPTPSN